MTRAGWVAIVAAIAFPTIALVVVLLVGPRVPPPGPGGGPPGPHGGPPPPPLDEEGLISLRGELELTDEQVERIREVGAPARQRATELQGSMREAEAALFEALSADSPDEATVRERLARVNELRAEMTELTVLTPLRLRAVMTEAQRARLVDLWRERRGPPPGGFGPPGPPGGAPHHFPPGGPGFGGPGFGGPGPGGPGFGGPPPGSPLGPQTGTDLEAPPPASPPGTGSDAAPPTP